jgi:FAD synthase
VGKTIPGRGVGAKIGFPTANIDPIGQVIPAEGVYAGYVVVGECLEDVVFETNGSALTSCGSFAISSATKRKTA